MFIFSSSNVEDLGIDYKTISKMKMESFLSKISSTGSLVKTASSENGKSALSVIAEALSEMGIKTEIDLSDLLRRIFMKVAETDQMEKTASKKSSAREETIKIASKEIKDSHYQIDISKNLVEKNGIKLYMVTAYATDSYLGRYLIKRNYYYLPDNEKEADTTFDEVSAKVKKIRDSYYKGNMEIKAISTDIIRVFQGVVSDMKFGSEDDIGTTVKRD